MMFTAFALTLYSAVAVAGRLHAVAPDTSAGKDQVVYLSGTGSDDAVEWEFFCTQGRRSGEWTTIPVPSNWELQGFGSYNYGHDRPKADEQGLYRHTFQVPAAWHDRQVRIVFEGVMTDTEVRINGAPAGPVQQGGFYTFEHDITGLVRFGDSNLLEVTVSKVSANPSVERAERVADFWVFGGIYRPVYLLARPVEHVDWTAIDARADGTFAITAQLGGVHDADHLMLELRDERGDAITERVSQPLARGQTTAVLRARAGGIAPWSPESPRLYHAWIRLRQGGRTIHEVSHRFGFRTIEMKPGDGFHLNGRKVRFKGVNRHCFWPTTGRALNRAISYQDARLILEMNMNAVRMAHYPPDKHFLDACDELGLMVINELTGWHDAYDTEVGRKLVASMIRRDVNHPSILMWANGNEGGHNLDLVPEYSRLDPQRRPVIHPTPSWVSPSHFNGVDTAHYPAYDDHLRRLAGRHIYLPTEFLHGLYDGGAGAGLYDYWRAIKASPVGAGGFLWALLDEGVVRADRGGMVDTDGNHAPDGILGPYREKSGSFESIRELWSPVQLGPFSTGPDFTGRIPVRNDYFFTSLDQCRFEWQWLDFPPPGGEASGCRVIHQGTLRGPSVPPDAAGEIQIELPTDWRHRDLLRLTARDAQGRELYTWTRSLRGPGAQRELLFRAGQGRVLAEEQNGVLTLVSGGAAARFDLADGRLLDVSRDGVQLSFGDGPRFVPADAYARLLPVAAVHAGGEEVPNVAAHAIDHDPSTRWSARGGAAWITLDLCIARSFREISIQWQDGATRRFRFTIESSEDNHTWRLLHQGESSGTNAGLESYPVGPVTARYVRVTGHGNTRNEWTSIHRILIPDGTQEASRVSHGATEGGYVIESSAHRRAFRWTFHPSGWIKLDYQMDLAGSLPYAGISFSYPETQVLAKAWIGAGPHRVWKNRMQGARVDAFSGLYNDPVPGVSWVAEPEFKGCFASLHRLRLKTREGDITFLTDTPDLFVRLFTPDPGSDPMQATAVMPEGDVSFLHAIPAIGTKFRSTRQLGPQSADHSLNGTFAGTLYMYFGPDTSSGVQHH